MKKIFKKLFGYKYIAFLYEGDCLSEFKVYYLISIPIDWDFVPNARIFFNSSAVSIDAEPYRVLYFKTAEDVVNLRKSEEIHESDARYLMAS